MSDVLGIIMLVTVVMMAILGIVWWKLRELAQRRTTELLAQYPNAQILSKNASFFGQESAGVTQLRGSGTLLLTDDDIVFEMWLPRKLIVIPLKSVILIETPTSFLGKTRFTPLVKVVFHNDNGFPDSVAWHVNNTTELIRTLNGRVTS